MTSQLFSPITVGGLELRNRIVIAPMCQYSAEDGSATDWHVVHLGALAGSGAALVTVEATAILPEGRITPRCLGLYSDANERALARVLRVVRRSYDVPLAIQLAHAGRKASTARPWEGRGPLPAGDGGWQTVGPSAVPLAIGWPTPESLTRAGMARIRRAAATAVRRAARLGFDVVELHSAHGYLASSFLSPLANRRTDAYGGSLENRMRFPLELVSAMREAWPHGRPLAAKINGTDWAEGGITGDDAVAYARALKAAGVDLVTVSGGGNALDAKIPAAAGYQVPFAERVRREVGVTTAAVGLITDPFQAEAIIAEGKADLVSMARALLFDPRWPYHAAVALGADLPYPPQYERAGPRLWAPGRAAAPARAGA